METGLTLSGVPLQAGEVWPSDELHDCDACNFPFHDGTYCEVAGGIVRLPDEEA